MVRPDRREEDWIRQHEDIILAAAWRLSSNAEWDDLYQEGQIAVWLLYNTQPNTKVVTAAVYNRLIDWCRYVKRQQRAQSASYEEVVGGLHDTDGGEHVEELPPVGDSS